MILSIIIDKNGEPIRTPLDVVSGENGVFSVDLSAFGIDGYIMHASILRQD